jgi:hypothetical protein
LEADSSVVGVTVDLEASLVDHYLMMEPAECDQILGVCWPTLGPGFEMVYLETVAAVATVCGASVAVAVDDGPS